MSFDALATKDPSPSLERVLQQWRAQHGDLWIFGYASLLWRPEFDFSECLPAKVHGWHRGLKMWSRVNRGTPQCPGLVFALLSGGSCQGQVFRIPRELAPEVLVRVWEREMPLAVYDPRWLDCKTPQGSVQALAFTLSRRSQSFTGELTVAQYRQIFQQAQGRYGSTREYAEATHRELQRLGIRDRALARLIALTATQHADRHH